MNIGSFPKYRFIAFSVNGLSQGFLNKYLWDLDHANNSHFFMNLALVDEDTKDEVWNYDDGFRRFSPVELPTVLGSTKAVILDSQKYQLEIYPYSYATIDAPENQIFVDIDLEKLKNQEDDCVHRYDIMVDGLSVTLYLQSEQEPK